MNPSDYPNFIRQLIRPLPPLATLPPRPIDQVLVRYAPLLSHDSPDRAAAIKHWTQVPPPTVPSEFPARDGSTLALACWTSLAIERAAACSPRPDSGQASRIFGRLIDRQRPSGALLHTTPSDNPETTWYHELVILHALTSFALTYIGSSEWFLPAIRRAALYHLHETQPDHATTQPWALNAFLSSPDTYPLADQLLHSLRTQHPSAPDPISTILLMDTLAPPVGLVD